MDNKTKIPIFCGKMDVDGVMDWIESLNNYFECEEVSEKQKVKISKSKYKGVALTSWNFVQGEMVKYRRSMITS